MPYIPEKHKKYDVLPHCRKRGGEVFEYPSKLLFQIEEIMGKNITPYGYDSYEEYFRELDDIESSASDPSLLKLLADYRAEIKRLNKKEDWSICKYIGKPIGGVYERLRPGHAYYWPATVDNPVHRGVIDEEEFTSYWYPTEADGWEILEDPTGMAYRTIFEKTNYVSRKQFDSVMEQLKTLNRKGDR